MSQASPLLLQHLPELRRAAELGPIIDLACGRGRNALALAREGIDCLGFDRNRDFLRELIEAALPAAGHVSGVLCDLECPHELPLRPTRCGAVLVFRFLFRPLAPAIERALAPGGLLLYETFTRDQPAHGWGPSVLPRFITASFGSHASRASSRTASRSWTRPTSRRA